MARDFTAASSEFLQIGQAVLTGVPITMSAWFNFPDIALSQSPVSIADASAGATSIRLRVRGSDNLVYAVTTDFSANSFSAVTSTTYTPNTWQHGCAVFAATNDRRVYLDGGNKGTNADGVTPTNLDVTAIGRRGGSSPDEYADGLIAEVAVWNIALTDDEVAILAKGYSPLFVHPQNIIAYWPLIRGLNDKVGGFNMTATGTAIAAHPGIIYTVIPQLSSSVVAAGILYRDVVGGFNMTPFNTPSVGTHPRVIYTIGLQPGFTAATAVEEAEIAIMNYNDGFVTISLPYPP